MEDPNMLFTLCSLCGGFLLVMGWLFHTFSMGGDLYDDSLGSALDDALNYAPESAESALSGIGNAIFNFETNETEMPIPSFFSIRVFRIIILIFGLGGNLGLLLGWDFSSSFMLGLFSGLIAGWVTYLLLKFIYKQVIHNIRDPRITGRIAQVTLDIPIEGFGQIILVVVKQRLIFRAKSETGIPISSGSLVIVTHKEKGICTVQPYTRKENFIE